MINLFDSNHWNGNWLNRCKSTILLNWHPDRFILSFSLSFSLVAHIIRHSVSDSRFDEHKLVIFYLLGVLCVLLMHSLHNYVDRIAQIHTWKKRSQQYWQRTGKKEIRRERERKKALVRKFNSRSILSVMSAFNV